MTLPAVHCAPFLGALDSVVFARWITQKLVGVSDNGCCYSRSQPPPFFKFTQTVANTHLFLHMNDWRAREWMRGAGAAPVDV